MGHSSLWLLGRLTLRASMYIRTYVRTCIHNTRIYIHVYIHIHTHTHNSMQVMSKSPRHAAKWGFPSGAFACLATLLSFGTILGLSARQYTPPISDSDIDQGLVAPAVAVNLLKGYGPWLFSILVGDRCCWWWAARQTNFPSIQPVICRMCTLWCVHVWTHQGTFTSHTNVENTCIFVYIQTDMHKCINTCTYIYIYVHVCIHTYIHTGIRSRIIQRGAPTVRTLRTHNRHTYIHTYIHTYVHTYIHTYIQAYAAASSSVAHHLSAFSELTINVYEMLFTRFDTSRADLVKLTRGALFVVTPLTSVACAVYMHYAAPASTLHLIRGIFTNSVVIIVIFAVTRTTCSSLGAAAGVVSGHVGGVISWLVSAYIVYGRCNSETLTSMEATLAANVASLVLSPVVAAGLSCCTQENEPFEWNNVRKAVRKGDSASNESKDGETNMPPSHRKAAVIFATASTILTLIIWPLLMLPVGVFNGRFLTFWMVLCGLLIAMASVTCIIIPMVDAYRTRPKKPQANSGQDDDEDACSGTWYEALKRRFDVLVQMESESEATLRYGRSLNSSPGSVEQAESMDGHEESKREPTDLTKSCREMIATRHTSISDGHSNRQDTSSRTVISASSERARGSVYLKRAYRWLCNGRDIRLTAPFPTTWEALRFIARAKTMIFVGACSTLFSSCISIIYVVGGYAIGCIAPGVHALLLILSFFWLRFANVHWRSRGVCVCPYQVLFEMALFLFVPWILYFFYSWYVPLLFFHVSSF